MQLVAILCSIYLAFVFSPDMPEDRVWRQTYEQCFVECIEEGISRHACNLYCVHKADKVYKGRKRFVKEGDCK